MSQTINVAPYEAVANSLTGGRRRKRGASKRGASKRGGKSRRNQSRNRNQAGGLFPGLGGIVHQALVPFGLYAMQHVVKNRSRGSADSGRSSSRIVSKFRRTSRRN
jgi:hypothetical protein